MAQYRTGPHRTVNRGADSPAKLADEHQIISRKMAIGKWEIWWNQNSACANAGPSVGFAGGGSFGGLHSGGPSGREKGVGKPPSWVGEARTAGANCLIVFE